MAVQSNEKSSPWLFTTELRQPKVHSRLTVNENLRIDFYTIRPNAWWRMWQWLLLGWRWEKLQ